MIEFAILPALCAAAVLCGDSDPSTPQADKDAQAILAVERGAFERWAKGDLSGFLDASDPEVDYFDPVVEARLEGLPALRALFNSDMLRTVSSGISDLVLPLRTMAPREMPANLPITGASAVSTRSVAPTLAFCRAAERSPVACGSAAETTTGRATINNIKRPIITSSSRDQKYALKPSRTPFDVPIDQLCPSRFSCCGGMPDAYSVRVPSYQL